MPVDPALQLDNFDFERNYEIGLGETNQQGILEMQVTPGMYKTRPEKFASFTSYYLTSDDLDLNSEKTVEVGWDETNTASLEIKPVVGVDNASVKTMVLNGVSCFFNNTQKIPVSLGQYKIHSVGMAFDGATYIFTEPGDSENFFNVSSVGQNYVFQPDLSSLQAYLTSSDPPITPGNSLSFKMTKPETPSGFVLEGVSGLDSFEDARVRLIGPNGSDILADKMMRYDQGLLVTDASWAAGTYILEVTRDIGSLYDPLVNTISIKIGSPKAGSYDVNKDGEINYSDLEEIGRFYGTEMGETDFQEKADLNGDGAVNLFDLVLLARQLSSGE